MEAGEIPARSRHCDRSFGRESDTFRDEAYSQPGTRYPQEFDMTASTFAPTAARPTAIPIREVLPWVIFGGLICLLGVYFVGAEEGATSIIKGMYVHEFVHDSRHLLGFPCH
jgi:Probable cobalt transporter subunit (CbtB)